MRAKQLHRIEVLVAFATLAAGCGSPIVAETTDGSVEQPEMPSVETQESIAEGEDPVGESPSNTVVDVTTTVSPTLEYSPAWIEWKQIQPYFRDDSLESTRIINNYMSGNPNDVSTPMGALCWAFYELSRSVVMDYMRRMLDDYMIPYDMEVYGVTSEQVGNPGPEATEAFLDLMSGDGGLVAPIDTGTGGQTVLPGGNEDAVPVGSTGAGSGSDNEFWEFLRLDHEFAGDGNAWSSAVRTVASPEMAAAFRSGEGLSPDVQVYADALMAFTRERVGREFDMSVETDDIDFQKPGFPGISSFLKVANYHQDCKRAWIDDITSTVDSSSASTTTIPPSTSTTTIQPTVDDTSPSTTNVTAPPSFTTTLPLADDAIPSSSDTTVPASTITTRPQVEDDSPSTTTTTPVLPVDDSVTTTTTTTTTTTLPFGGGDPSPDDGEGSGLFDEEEEGGA